ncbi:MAG: HAD family hydrolase [Coprobacillaceae bacterium]
MNLKVIIFDVDGLLLDTEARWQTAWQEIGMKHGIKDFGKTTFLKCVGLNGKEVEEIVKKDLEGYKYSKVILQEARDYGMKLLHEHIDPKPGVYELLDYIKKTPIKIAVATSTDRNLTIERLTRLQLLENFDYVLCEDEVVNRKPHPEVYQKVIQYFNVLPEEALVLEDSAVGVEAAYCAHIPCIMIPDLIPATKKQIEQTRAIVSSLHEVKKFLQ